RRRSRGSRRAASSRACSDRRPGAASCPGSPDRLREPEAEVALAGLRGDDPLGADRLPLVARDADVEDERAARARGPLADVARRAPSLRGPELAARRESLPLPAGVGARVLERDEG